MQLSQSNVTLEYSNTVKKLAFTIYSEILIVCSEFT